MAPSSQDFEPPGIPGRFMVLQQWIESAIVNFLVPGTFSHETVAIAADGGSILAISVPPSRHVVSLWDREDHTIEYLRRTSYGKDWMNPDEMERHMVDGSRAAKLAVDSAKAQATVDRVDIAGGVWLRHEHSNPDQRWNPSGSITFGQINAHWFELRVPNQQQILCVTVPYGVVGEAWVGADGAVSLLLGVRLILKGGELSLEPR